MHARTCAVVVTSHNRCDDLRLTCQQLRRLSPAPAEVIICLDGCTDGSKEMLAGEFPDYLIIENVFKQGSIPSRDRAFRMVKSDLILTLDDDSHPIDPAFIEKIAAIAEQHPEAGAITFPEIRNDGNVANATRSTRSPAHYVRDFSDCATVIVRPVYGRDAEYALFFSHAYDEPDFCLQLYAAGYAVWFEPSLVIRHRYTSKERNMLTRHWLNARNELWSVVMRCPFPYLLLLAPFRIVRQFLFALSNRVLWAICEPIWWLRAIKGLPMCLRQRKPIGWRTYWEWLMLARRPASTVEDLRTRFPHQFGAIYKSE